MYSRTKCCLNLGDPFSFSWLVFMLCLIPRIVTESPIEDVKIFSDPFNAFNHLVVDKDRGWVFIGAVNRLYQLFSNLSVNQNLSTIPIFDSSRTEDNYNKILVLDYENSRLISCGSRFQGSCEIYKIFNRSMDRMPSKLEPVTVNNPKTSTVAFIVSNPTTQGNNNKKTPALCVAVTYTKNDQEIPAIATRSLEEKQFNLFQIIKSDSSIPIKMPIFSTGAQISFNSSYLQKYIVNYVYGFSSGSQSYFMTTQMNSTQSSPYESKLIRICQKDHHYNSYTEIPISCTDEGEKVYNLVQAAFIAKPSFELAKSLGITTQDDVLFGIFSKSKKPLSNEPSSESALCMYSLKAINDKFTENIQNCQDGKVYRGLEHILPKENCSTKSSSSFGSCGIALNTPFGGKIPIQATPIIAFDKLSTAVAAVLQTDFILVIVGTYTGYLQLFALMNTTTAWKLKDIALNETFSVNSDLQFDKNNEYLYAMTEHMLTRIKIRDHLPLISYVSPDKGPWEGGTNVTIGIKNFGNLFTGNHPEIKIADIPCISYEHNFNSSEIVCRTANSSASKVHDGQIEVFIQGIRMANGTKFTFVDPKIFKVSCNKLTSSSVNLTIDGEHLNAGNSISVLIGNASCQIFSKKSNKIQCNTNLSAGTIEGNIIVKIDDSIRIDESNCMYDVSPKHISELTVDNTNQPHNFWQSEIIAGIPTLYLLFISIFGLVVLTFIIIVTCILTHKKFSESSQTLMKMQQNMNNACMETIALRQCIKKIIIEKHIDLNEESSNVLKLPTIAIVYTPVPTAIAETSPELDYLLPLDNKWEFSRSKLLLGKHIGEGEFGKVFQGEALGILYADVTTTVAVKMLKDTHSDADIIALASEMELMKLIGTHENVVRLLGCCTQDGDLLVITEYALHGNLRDFLRKYLPSANDKIMSKKLSENDLLTFSVQIASGMDYLASIKCIHRDLAARNILVSEDYVMKIGDFGLARDIHETYYYKKKSDGRLPIKWLAPEALCHSVYTTQSDVWSYGVLLWEIMTLGGTPYPSFPDLRKLYQALHSGYRMEKPPRCSQDTYFLMTKCWSFLPENRPSFSMIIQYLEKIMSSKNDEAN